MKNSYPPPKQSRRRAKRKNHYTKYQSARKPLDQGCKKIRDHGGRNDYHTA
ncbi:hypothetical protein [Psychrobacter faecalis]|uniref:hypothetical protein n=1 Tax=Psychrobacter faecalis TaxID=180588 RepID=UPI003FD1BE90